MFISVVFFLFLSCSALLGSDADYSKNVSNQIYYLNGSFVENGKVITGELADFYEAVVKDTNIIKFDNFF